MTEFNEDSNTPTKKVKVQVRAYHTLIFSAKLQQKVKVWHTLIWTFTFFVGIFAIFGELSHLSLLSGTSSILRTFLGGTSQKRHPVYEGCPATMCGCCNAPRAKNAIDSKATTQCNNYQSVPKSQNVCLYLTLGVEIFLVFFRKAFARMIDTWLICGFSWERVS